MKARYLGFFLMLLLPAMFLFHSCGPQSTEAKATIEEVDGVTIVKNPLEPMNPELEILFEEDLKIGMEFGDDNYMFGSRVLINSDQDGNIYVTDAEVSTVKKYDTDGRFLQTIGGSGQGPGEFQSISQVRFSADGNIYINDESINRISFMSKEGVYLRDAKAPQIFQNVLVNSKGYFIARSADNVKLGKGKQWDWYYGLFDDRFELIAEFLRLPQEIQVKTSEFSIVQALADDLSKRAFVPTVSYVLDKDDLLYFGYPDNYEIKVYSSFDGKLKKIIKCKYEPVEISRKHKEYFEQNQSDQFMSKMPTGMEKEVFELVEYPKYKPAYERLTLMENGWIFVVVDSVRGGAQLIDIFNQNGEYLAQFETEIPTAQLFFNNGKAYTLETIDDYQYIKRYNLEISGEPDN
jgi:hypothetical protein